VASELQDCCLGGRNGDCDKPGGSSLRCGLPGKVMGRQPPG
jgi:hypothetical protein